MSFPVNLIKHGAARWNADGTGLYTPAGNFVGLGRTVYIYPGQTAAQVNATILASFGTLAASTGGTLVFLAGVHDSFEASIFIPYNVSVLCEPTCVFKPPLGASYTAGYLFLINTNDGVNWVTAYTNCVGAFFQGAYLDNSLRWGTITAKLVVTGAAHIFHGLYGRAAHGMIATTNNYIDKLKISSVHSADPKGTDYQIVLTNLGDGLSIDSVSFYVASGDDGARGIKLVSCQGGRIDALINGTIDLEGCRAVTIANPHGENSGKIILNNSDAVIDNAFIWKRDAAAGPRIEITSTSAPKKRRRVTLRDCSFMFNQDHVITPGPDVSKYAECDLIIENCRTVVTRQGAIAISQQYGITVVQDDKVTPIAPFADQSALLSMGCVIKGYEVTRGYVPMDCGQATAGFSAPILSSNITWRAAAGTYYYQAQAIFDRNRKLGVTSTSGERSIAMTAGGQGALFTNVVPRAVLVPIKRIYRGTVSGSYDAYVDLPAIQTDYVYDDGVVCNGFPWIARAAGPVETLQDIRALELSTGYNATTRAVVRHTAMPTAGSFEIGDTCEIDTPAAGGVSRYRYTSTGWKAEATLAA